MNSTQLGLTVRVSTGWAIIVSTRRNYVHVVMHENDLPATIPYQAILEYGDYLPIDETLTHGHPEVRKIGKHFVELVENFRANNEKIPKWLLQRLSS